MITFTTRQTSASQHVLEVTIDSQRVEEAYRTAFQERRKHLKIKGFRKGNVPEPIARKHLKDSLLANRVVNLLVPPAYKEALKQSALSPLGKPDWELKQNERGKDLIFEATLHVMPILEIEGYRGYKLTLPRIEISDDRVEQILYQKRQGVSRYLDRPKDHKAALGDFAFIDYTSTHNGKPLPHASVKNFLLEMQNEKFLPGFVDALVGAEAGEERVFQLTLPLNYAEKSLAGETVEFTVKIHQLKERRVPEMDDNFAKTYSKFQTIKELKETVKANLLKQERQKQEEEATHEIVRTLVAKTDTAEVPLQLQDGHAGLALRNHTRNLEKQGLTMEQYLAKRGISSEHFREELGLTGLVEGRLEIFYRSIASAEGIQVLKKEVDQAIAGQAQSAGVTTEALKAQMLKEDTYKLLAYRILIQKVRHKLFELADIEYLDVDKLESPKVSKPKAASKKKAKSASKKKSKPASKPKTAAKKKAKAGSKAVKKKKAASKKKVKAKSKTTPKKKSVSKKKAKPASKPKATNKKSKAKAKTTTKKKAAAKKKSTPKPKPVTKTKVKSKSKASKKKSKARNSKKSQ